MPAPAHGVEPLARGVLAGDRRALAKAITLIESTRAEHRERAQALLAELLPATGGAIRMGISGAPGAGKSTFIEALGLFLTAAGHKVAVLAVDPSSAVSGGSILGDKTRMEDLSRDPNAFIRPSPSGGTLGGVAARTREAILACEAAGFDVVIVETVGVGQSETAVAGMTDVFVLLQLPNAGDELQAIKRGIIELADIVVYNKTDLDPRAAEVAMGQMKSALSLLRSPEAGWRAPVLGLSALRREGIEAFWREVLRCRDALAATSELAAKRRRQSLDWMWTLIDTGLRERFHAHPGVKGALPECLAEVAAGTLTPAAAASRLLDTLERRTHRA
jgi:LAO/AO transport system kinase